MEILSHFDVGVGSFNHRPPPPPPRHIFSLSPPPPLEPITASLDLLCCSDVLVTPRLSQRRFSYSFSMAELNLLDESEDAEQDAQSANKSRGKKSCRSKTIQDRVIRAIDWPQYHVYRVVDRRPAK